MNKITEKSSPLFPLSGNTSNIRRRFNNAAKTYDENSSIQARIANNLIMQMSNQSPATILEIGCGTGLLSLQLAKLFPNADINITDISPEMLTITTKKLQNQITANQTQHTRHIHITNLNPETDFSSNPLHQKFDLILSSMTIHWFENIIETLTTIQKQLTPNGSFYYSTIGPDCFAQWQQALINQNLPLGLRLPPALPGIYKTEQITVPYGSAHAFLRSLKNTGAQSPRQTYTPLTPTQLKAAMSELEKISPSSHNASTSDTTDKSRKAAGTSVTWQIQYGKLSGK